MVQVPVQLYLVDPRNHCLSEIDGCARESPNFLGEGHLPLDRSMLFQQYLSVGAPLLFGT
jgi:hypothetical protein